jgi:hypothetical protein
MPKRAAIALVLVFVVTRFVSGWLAHNPEIYRGDTYVAGDVSFYHFYASRIMDGGEKPYEQVKVEYPPGSLVLITVPYALSSDPETYRILFIAEMILIDALGAIALLILGRRWRSRWGVWAWVFLIPFLGPIAHVRLDLVPAVLTIWAFERASARRWLEAGAAIGVGTAVKLYPIALLPILLIVAYRRRQVLVGAALPIVAAVLPYVGSLPELYDSVIGYQTERGVQVESTWGLLLLVLSAFGLTVSVAYNFGAYHVASSLSRFLDTLSTLASAGAAAVVYWFTYRRVERGDVRAAASASFALISLLLAVAAVWSPQFLIWVIALAAVFMCARGDDSRRIAYVLAGAGIASQIAYPFAYADLLGANTALSALLLIRNLAVLGLGVAVLTMMFPELRPRRRRVALQEG